MFGFCALIISSCLWPSLPEPEVLPWLLMMAMLALVFSTRISGGLFAVAWLVIFSQFYVPTTVVKQQVPIRVKGEIISLVRQNSDSLGLDISLLETNAPILAPKLRLYWRIDDNVIKPTLGQVWQWTIKPKAITSVLNQGGFNQQKYRISQHVIGRGRVVEAKLLGVNYSLRQDLISRLYPITTKLAQGDILQAILVGDKQLIPRSQS